MDDHDLAQLFNRYGSDKDRNGYTSLYHTLFDRIRHLPLSLLEIGIGTMIPGAPSSMVGYALSGYRPGGSLRAWRDYFPNANIQGADVQPDTQLAGEERITTHLCDSTDRAGVERVFGSMAFDIIIDDGSHYPEHQLATLANLYPRLKEGGTYVIEDIYPGSPLSAQPWLVGERCSDDPYFFAGVRSNLCVIYKKHLDLKMGRNF